MSLVYAVFFNMYFCVAHCLLVLCLLLLCVVIFFFKQKTAYEMRISDWSSDVCSSDLVGLPRSKRYDSTIEHMLQFMPALAAEVEVNAISGMDPTRHDSPNDFLDRELLIYALAYSGTFAAIDKIGRASCRERVCQYV